MTNLDDDIAARFASDSYATRQLAATARKTLQAIAADVRAGLAETVGVGAMLNDGEQSSVIIELPVLPDAYSPEYIARAIDAENVEAWCDEQGGVHVAINPWYSTKDYRFRRCSQLQKLCTFCSGCTRPTRAATRAGFWRRLLIS